MTNIKAIIFDWGGVLINDPAPGLVSYCSNALGVSPEEFKKAHKLYEPEFQKGTISETAFWEKVCAKLNVSKPHSQSLWGEAFRKVYSPKNEMFDLAASLRKNGYKIALLSNTELPAMKYFYEQNYNIFDVLTFSCIENTRKPEKRIFEISLRKLNVKPIEAIFIDDKQKYIDAAKQVDLGTILFNSPLDVKKELLFYSVKTGNQPNETVEKLF